MSHKKPSENDIEDEFFNWFYQYGRYHINGRY